MLFDGFSRLAFGPASEAARSAYPAAAASPEAPARKRRIGLALGAGAARGWAHIGVLRVLEEAGIRPDVIAGCSIGAVVGGCYAAGKLDAVEAFARSLSKRRVMGLLDLHFSGSGLISGNRLRRLLEQDLVDAKVEDLPRRFATVATEFGSGHEIWLTRGSLIEAMRASYALPGVFDPVRVGGRLLMDGALVNPIPVSVARAFGADLVICVNLNGDTRLRGTVIQSSGEDELVESLTEESLSQETPPPGSLLASMKAATLRRRQKKAGDKKGGDMPGLATVMIDAFNITQDRIARSRLAGDPPDAMLVPKLAGIGIFEFHRAEEAIDLGRAAAERLLPELRELAGLEASPAPEATGAPLPVQGGMNATNRVTA